MVKDFLYQCFQKDPNLRITAKKIAKHPWMIAVQRQVESGADRAKPTNTPGHKRETSNARIPRIYVPKRQQTDRSATGRTISDTNSAASTNSEPTSISKTPASHSLENIANRPLTTVYDQAIQRVREWNAALNGQSIQRQAAKGLGS